MYLKPCHGGVIEDKQEVNDNIMKHRKRRYETLQFLFIDFSLIRMHEP